MSGLVDLALPRMTTEQLIELLRTISDPRQPVDPNSEHADLELAILQELAKR